MKSRIPANSRKYVIALWAITISALTFIVTAPAAAAATQQAENRPSTLSSGDRSTGRRRYPVTIGHWTLQAWQVEAMKRPGPEPKPKPKQWPAARADGDYVVTVGHRSIWASQAHRERQAEAARFRQAAAGPTTASSSASQRRSSRGHFETRGKATIWVEDIMPPQQRP